MLKVGASKVEIVFPIDTFPLHTHILQPLAGIHDSVHVRVVAVEAGDSRLIFIGSAFRWEGFQRELEEKLSDHGFQPADVIVFRTGSHCVPMIFDHEHTIPEKYRAEAQRNTCCVRDAFLRAIEEACQNMTQARYGIGSDKCFVNCERCFTTENGFAHEVCMPGVPVDRTMQILYFEDLHGRPIAGVLNYDLLASSLMLAKDIDGRQKITDDLPGFACGYVERRLGGDFVLAWVDGGSGNCWMAHNSVLYDDEGLPYDFAYVDGALYQIVEAQSQECAMVALRILKNISCTRDSAAVRSARTRVWLPGQEVLPGLRGALNVSIAHMNGIYPGDDHVRVRDIIERNGGTCPLMPGEEYPPKLILPRPTGEDIPVDIRMFLFDDICLFIPEGHYFTGTERKCKDAAKTPHLMFLLATVLADSFSNHGYIYILDDQHQDMKSFERVHSKVYPGKTDAAIVKGMLELFDKLNVDGEPGRVVYYYQ